jgi:hypothetical protein
MVKSTLQTPGRSTSMVLLPTSEPPVHCGRAWDESSSHWVCTATAQSRPMAPRGTTRLVDEVIPTAPAAAKAVSSMLEAGSASPYEENSAKWYTYPTSPSRLKSQFCASLVTVGDP